MATKEWKFFWNDVEVDEATYKDLEKQHELYVKELQAKEAKSQEPEKKTKRTKKAKRSA